MSDSEAELRASYEYIVNGKGDPHLAELRQKYELYANSDYSTLRRSTLIEIKLYFLEKFIQMKFFDLAKVLKHSPLTVHAIDNMDTTGLSVEAMLTTVLDSRNKDMARALEQICAKDANGSGIIVKTGLDHDGLAKLMLKKGYPVQQFYISDYPIGSYFDLDSDARNGKVPGLIHIDLLENPELNLTEVVMQHLTNNGGIPNQSAQQSAATPASNESTSCTAASSAVADSALVGQVNETDVDEF